MIVAMAYGPENVACQNEGSQIQGDNNYVALANTQRLAQEIEEPSPMLTCEGCVAPLAEEQIPAFDADLDADDLFTQVAGTAAAMEMKLNKTAGADTGVSVDDLFEMQMLLNHFSQ
jgi:hypothetical protein